MKWYNKVYTGRKVQYMWQASFGVSVFLTMVFVPGCMDYIMIREGKKYVGSTLSKGSFVSSSQNTDKVDC